MRFFSPSLAIGLLLLLCCLHATTPSVRGYYFSESKEDLATLESTPGVSIVYPRAVGPSATEVEGAPSDVKGSEEVATAATTTTTAPPTTTTTTATADAEAATTTTTTTTAAPTTTDASSSESTPGTSSSSSSSTTTPPSASVEANVNLPFGIRASASASSVSSSPSVSSSNNNGGVNRLWHYNSQGLNTNSIWFSPVSSSSRAAAAAGRTSGGLTGSAAFDSESGLESSQSPVSVRPEAALSTASTQASLPSPTASTTTTTTTTSAAASPNPVFFRRQPILADENSASSEIDGNSLSRRIGSPTNRAVVGSFGEYRGRGESERNLYYPDISRIQSASSNSANSGLLASSSSSSSSSTSASTSSASTAASNSAASFGFKGGAGFQSNQNLWTQSERFTAPVKSVRKVVKTSSQLLNEAAEKTTFNREPVRVRVVVQKPQITTGSFGGVKAEFQNNYLERLQEANNNRKSQATASAAASASSSQSFFTTAAKSSKTVSKFNEYASKATDSSEKEYITVTNQFTHAGIKSPPPPPRPAAVKTTTYATKSAVKSVVRQPVFEQQTYDRYEVEQPEPEPYSYNWQYGDETGNGQFRREEQDKNGVVRGSYGYTDAWGLYRVVDFIADKDGYRASIRSNEPGLVERNPVTNQVDAPANIKIAAEDTPQKVVELMRLTKPKKVTYQ